MMGTGCILSGSASCAIATYGSTVSSDLAFRHAVNLIPGPVFLASLSSRIPRTTSVKREVWIAALLGKQDLPRGGGELQQ